MVRTYALSAAVVAGGLLVAAGSPASAAPASGKSIAKLDAAVAQGEVMTVGWRGRGWGGRGWGGRRYYYAPRYYVRPRAYYYAPRYSYRRCWINGWGYRVCG